MLGEDQTGGNERGPAGERGVGERGLELPTPEQPRPAFIRLCVCLAADYPEDQNVHTAQDLRGVRLRAGVPPRHRQLPERERREGKGQGNPPVLLIQSRSPTPPPDLCSRAGTLAHC